MPLSEPFRADGGPSKRIGDARHIGALLSPAALDAMTQRITGKGREEWTALHLARRRSHAGRKFSPRTLLSADEIEGFVSFFGLDDPDDLEVVLVDLESLGIQRTEKERRPGDSGPFTGQLPKRGIRFRLSPAKYPL